MFKILDKLARRRIASPSASPRESISAGHGLHRSILAPASRSTLPSDRRGHLKNGNRPGDFLAAPRCGARTRCGGECRQPAMPNGRCRLHGGLSTGPRTPEGLARSRRARLTHGGYSARVRALRTAARAHSRRVRALAALIRARPRWAWAPSLKLCDGVRHDRRKDPPQDKEVKEPFFLARAQPAFPPPLCPLW